jgi:hypothetical protein
MEIAVKVAVYLTLGIALVALNAWYAGAVYRSFAGGDLVIAPVKMVGATGDAAAAGETLARMIISKLQSLEWDLRQSQSALRPDDSKKDAGKKPDVAGPPPTARLGGVTAGILGTPKTAVLNAQLFEPTTIDVKVAGVDVGGLLPRIQRWFVADRTLAFSVSWEGKTATITGSIDALGIGKTRPVWMSIENATANSIADAIALALIHRRWAKDSVEFGDLEDNEFNQLVVAINDVARINRRVVTYNAAAKADFENVLPSVEPLADRMSGWSELTYFVASIAEAAEKYDRALTLYRRIQSSPKPPVAADILEAKIAMLAGITTTPTGDTKQTALQKLKKSIDEATAVFNRLFGLSLPPPELELLGDDVLNAYWDGKKIFAPTTIQDIPDIVYHETAWPFIQAKWRFRYEGQPGTLAQSYTDVLASLVKQTVGKQEANSADWTIGPGAIAWITQKPKDILVDKRPLRSLKAPGTAYDDPVIGKDPQVDHFSKLVKGSEDSGGVHTNSGIPNKAFYEAAMKIGSDKAGRIWIASLPKFSETTDLRRGSQAIYRTAVELYGEGSAEAKAVKAAWDSVGL